MKTSFAKTIWFKLISVLIVGTLFSSSAFAGNYKYQDVLPKYDDGAFVAAAVATVGLPFVPQVAGAIGGGLNMGLAGKTVIGVGLGATLGAAPGLVSNNDLSIGLGAVTGGISGGFGTYGQFSTTSGKLDSACGIVETIEGIDSFNYNLLCEGQQALREGNMAFANTALSDVGKVMSSCYTIKPEMWPVVEPFGQQHMNKLTRSIAASETSKLLTQAAVYSWGMDPTDAQMVGMVGGSVAGWAGEATTKLGQENLRKMYANTWLKDFAGKHPVYTGALTGLGLGSLQAKTTQVLYHTLDSGGLKDREARSQLASLGGQALGSMAWGGLIQATPHLYKPSKYLGIGEFCSGMGDVLKEKQFYHSVLRRSVNIATQYALEESGEKPEYASIYADTSTMALANLCRTWDWKRDQIKQAKENGIDLREEDLKIDGLVKSVTGNVYADMFVGPVIYGLSALTVNEMRRDVKKDNLLMHDLNTLQLAELTHSGIVALTNQKGWGAGWDEFGQVYTRKQQIFSEQIVPTLNCPGVDSFYDASLKNSKLWEFAGLELFSAKAQDIKASGGNWRLQMGREVGEDFFRNAATVISKPSGGLALNLTNTALEDSVNTSIKKIGPHLPSMKIKVYTLEIPLMKTKAYTLERVSPSLTKRLEDDPALVAELDEWVNNSAWTFNTTKDGIESPNWEIKYGKHSEERILRNKVTEREYPLTVATIQELRARGVDENRPFKTARLYSSEEKIPPLVTYDFKKEKDAIEKYAPITPEPSPFCPPLPEREIEPSSTLPKTEEGIITKWPRDPFMYPQGPDGITEEEYNKLLRTNNWTPVSKEEFEQELIKERRDVFKPPKEIDINKYGKELEKEGSPFAIDEITFEEFGALLRIPDDQWTPVSKEEFNQMLIEEGSPYAEKQTPIELKQEKVNSAPQKLFDDPSLHAGDSIISPEDGYDIEGGNFNNGVTTPEMTEETPPLVPAVVTPEICVSQSGLEIEDKPLVSISESSVAAEDVVVAPAQMLASLPVMPEAISSQPDERIETVLPAHINTAIESVKAYRGLAVVEEESDKFGIKLNNTADGSILDVGLNLTDGLKLKAGSIEGNREISPLQLSPYGAISYKVEERAPDFVADAGVEVSLFNLVQDAGNKQSHVVSTYTSAARRHQLNDNLYLGLGIAHSYAATVATPDFNGVKEEIIPTQAALGGSLSYTPSEKDVVTLGTGASAKLVKIPSIQDQRKTKREIFFEGYDIWLRYLTNRFRKPVESEINYAKNRMGEAYAISANISKLKGNTSVGLNYEETSSKEVLFPDQRISSIYLTTSPDYLKGAKVNISASSQKDDYGPLASAERKEMIFATLTVPLGKIIESDYGEQLEKSLTRENNSVPSALIQPTSYEPEECYEALKTMPYDKFLEDFVGTKVKSENDALWLGLAVGATLGYYNYNDGNYEKDVDEYRVNTEEIYDVNTISHEEIYNAMQESLNTGEEVPATVCRGIMPFMAAVMNVARLEHIVAYSSQVETPEGGHVVAPLATPKQVYMLDYGRIPAGSRNPELAHQLYQKLQGVIAVRHRLYKDGEYLTDISTPDSRLFNKAFTIQEGKTAQELLKGSLLKLEPRIEAPEPFK